MLLALFYRSYPWSLGLATLGPCTTLTMRVSGRKHPATYDWQASLHSNCCFHNDSLPKGWRGRQPPRCSPRELLEPANLPSLLTGVGLDGPGSCDSFLHCCRRAHLLTSRLRGCPAKVLRQCPL